MIWGAWLILFLVQCSVIDVSISVIQSALKVLYISKEHFHRAKQLNGQKRYTWDWWLFHYLSVRKQNSLLLLLFYHLVWLSFSYRTKSWSHLHKGFSLKSPCCWYQTQHRHTEEDESRGETCEVAEAKIGLLLLKQVLSLPGKSPELTPYLWVSTWNWHLITNKSPKRRTSLQVSTRKLRCNYK